MGRFIDSLANDKQVYCVGSIGADIDSSQIWKYKTLSSITHSYNESVFKYFRCNKYELHDDKYEKNIMFLFTRHINISARQIFR